MVLVLVMVLASVMMLPSSLLVRLRCGVVVDAPTRNRALTASTAAVVAAPVYQDKLLLLMQHNKQRHRQQQRPCGHENTRAAAKR